MKYNKTIGLFVLIGADMSKQDFGYVRVSTHNQNVNRQVQQMKDQGIVDRNIFIDKESGVTFQRNKYQAMLEIIRPGDTIFISSIDRLGRNYTEILNQWRYIVTHLKADIAVLDMPLLDTRDYKDIAGKLISDIVLQLLSYVAEKERDQLRVRQREGIEIAKAKGTSFGRPRLNIDADRFKEFQELIVKGLATHAQAQLELGLKHSTYFNLVKEYRSKTRRFTE